MVPHAGYLYSGEVAARAYVLLKPFRHQIRRVVLLGPTHRQSVCGMAIPSVDVFDTPIGNIPLDRKTLSALLMIPGVVVSDEVHAFEHSLEVQLPFLKCVLDTFDLVPMAIGQIDHATVMELVEQVWGGEETVLIVSTDLSHFHSGTMASRHDRATLRRILNLSPTLSLEDACGAVPLNGVLRSASERGLRAEVIAATHSGHTTGDMHRVVGYGAVALWPDVAPLSEPFPLPDVSDEDGLGEAMLTLARNTLAEQWGMPLMKVPPHASLSKPGAVFVTWYREGRHVACHGRLVAGNRPLEVEIWHHAMAGVQEALTDTRPSAEEQPLIEVEITLIESLEAMASETEASVISGLIPGRDGLVFSYKRHHSNLLPHAWNDSPKPLDFLKCLKERAGLASDFWSPEVHLYRYPVKAFRGAMP
jgi:AmmeMemoRadiSam system protein B